MFKLKTLRPIWLTPWKIARDYVSVFGYYVQAFYKYGTDGALFFEYMSNYTGEEL